MMHSFRSVLAIAGLVIAFARLSAQPPPARTAIVGGTVIDGNGGAPIADAIVIVAGDRIAAVGPRAEIAIPAGRRRSTRAAGGSCPA